MHRNYHDLIVSVNDVPSVMPKSSASGTALGQVESLGHQPYLSYFSLRGTIFTASAMTLPSASLETMTAPDCPFLKKKSPSWFHFP